MAFHVSHDVQVYSKSKDYRLLTGTFVLQVAWFPWMLDLYSNDGGNFTLKVLLKKHIFSEYLVEKDDIGIIYHRYELNNSFCLSVI